MKKVSVIAAAVAASLAAGSAFAVDFNGYMRAGIGISGETGADQSYNKNAIGRLGNENDNYYEFGLSEELKTGEQTWRVESMIAQGNNGAKGWEDGDFNVAQFAVKAKGVLSFDREATLWAGKTYYQRKDIHITDFYFLNTSGTGGGIENISIGDQKLSLAIIQDDQRAFNSDDKAEKFDKYNNGAGYIFDARLANIALWDNASLELAMAYNFGVEAAEVWDSNTNAEQAQENKLGDDGVLSSAIIHQGLDNGFNQTIFQYGTAGYGKQAANFWGAGTYYDRTGDQDDAKGFRIINWGVLNVAENIEVGHQLAFLSGTDLVDRGEEDKTTGASSTTKYDQTQFSVVVRPVYKWNDTMRTIAEVGYNAGEKEFTGGTTEDFGSAKLTLAQAWAMGDSFWSRPEIRVYGSYLKDLEGENEFGLGEDTDFVVGIQAEAWW